MIIEMRTYKTRPGCRAKFLEVFQAKSIPAHAEAGAQERLSPMCNLRFPRKRPMSAPKIAVAMIAAPCAPSACPRVENGHAIRQPALIARPAAAPYRAPAKLAASRASFETPN